MSGWSSYECLWKISYILKGPFFTSARPGPDGWSLVEFWGGVHTWPNTQEWFCASVYFARPGKEKHENKKGTAWFFLWSHLQNSFFVLHLQNIFFVQVEALTVLRLLLGRETCPKPLNSSSDKRRAASDFIVWSTSRQIPIAANTRDLMVKTEAFFKEQTNNSGWWLPNHWINMNVYELMCFAQGFDWMMQWLIGWLKIWSDWLILAEVSFQSPRLQVSHKSRLACRMCWFHPLKWWPQVCEFPPNCLCHVFQHFRNHSIQTTFWKVHIICSTNPFFCGLKLPMMSFDPGIPRKCFGHLHHRQHHPSHDLGRLGPNRWTVEDQDVLFCLDWFGCF